MVPMLIGGSINTIGYGIATLGSALGVAWIFASLINGTARQPEAHKPMFQATMIGFAVPGRGDVVCGISAPPRPTKRCTAQ